jgi:hypothetical protein
VESIPVSAEMDKRRATFLRLLFEGGKGYFCVAYGPKDRNPKGFREEFFEFPDEIPTALELINTVHASNNVWFCPHLFDKRKRRKENVTYTPCAWSDLDTCEPEVLFVDPTIVIESSPGRYQGLWMFERAIDPDEAENLSKRIAYTHADDGADRSGWDLTQLLRFPYTYNFKYATLPIVNIIEVNRKRYRLADFENDYEELADFTYVDTPMPELIEDADELLQRERLKMNPTIWRLYQEKLPDEASWSEPLWKLMMLLFEAGFDAAQVLSITNEAACNKYEKRGQGLAFLWKDVCRAEAKYLQNTDAFAGNVYTRLDPLVTDEERDLIRSSDTFIERYIEWAKSLGDAAPQYHQAGAFTVLSALLAGGVQLATSFGTIKPNLWFMILADTTLTRKSTAMDIAMDLAMEVDEDILMATDGSLEGLLTSLSTRPGKPSVFLRDEFSGLLEMITKKDYYAGMPELLTKLYDGKLQKRILRKEQIEVKDPCLLVFAGGIKDKITSLLSFEHVSSGFMPRFIFITAESDVTRVKPLGPPTDWTDTNREAIRDELIELYEFYNETTMMQVKDTKITYEVNRKFDAKLTAEAWHRYNMIETQMLDAGMSSERPAIMTPVFDRLSKSILKAAVLLACTKQRSDPVIVEEVDIIRAAAYGEQWRDYVIDVMNNVGKGGVERNLDNILNAIQRKPGVTRSEVMRNYHLNARQANEIFETLEQRTLITRTKNGKAEQLFPTVIRKRGTA